MVFRSVLAVAMLAFAVSGCGGSDPGLPTVVTAVAQAGSPNAGTLTLSDGEGNVLGQADFRGGAVTTVSLSGSALRLVLALPDGTAALGVNSTGAYLAARVQAYTPGEAIVLSPLSTLVDAYLTSHPGMDQPVAQAKVLAYLGLPPDTEINSIVPASAGGLFDVARFYQAAGGPGGMGALTQQAVAAIDAGQTRSFGPAKLLGDAEETAWEIAESLAGDFDTWAGAKIKGWLLQVTGVTALLDSLGLGDHDKTAEQLQALTTEVKRLEELVKGLPLQINWQTRLNQLSDLVATVRTATNYLVDIASRSPPTPADIDKQFLTPLNSSTNTLQASIHNNQVGAGPKDQGLIELMLIDHPKYYVGNPDIDYDKSLYLQQRQSDILQAQAMQLKVEAAHGADKPRMALAEGYMDDYFVYTKQQRLMYPYRLARAPFDGVLDRNTGLLWANSMVDFPGYDSAKAAAANSGWRLPTVAELLTLFDNGKVIPQLAEDHRKQYLPQQMIYFGFRPETYSPGVYKDFADLGQPAEHPYKILGPGWAVAADTFHHQTDESGNYDVNANIVNLYDARTESIVIKNCWESGERNCHQNRDTSGPVVPWLVPLLLVRDAVVPVELNVSFSQGFNSVTGLATATASLRDSTGVWRDVTKEVIWKVSGTQPAHVSNSRETSGVVQYRGETGKAVEFTVTAEYPWHVSFRDKQHGVLTNSAKLYGSENVAAPTLKSLIVSPTNSKISQYPLDLPLTAIGILSNGVPVDQASGLTWSVSDPAVQISAAGRVTASRPAERKEIQVTVTRNGVKGFGYLVLAP